MARLEAPVTNTSRRAPASRASSTAYWISGLSTMGSISFGLALVAGRKRVPRPATGNTATSIRLCFDFAGMWAPAFQGAETLPCRPCGLAGSAVAGGAKLALLHAQRDRRSQLTR